MILVITGSAVVAPIARAGIGSAVSGTAVIDTRPPVVTVDQLPTFSVFLGGDTVNFHWQTGDDHPGTDAICFWATIWIDGIMEYATSYYPDTEDFVWQWVVPERSSANVYLEVSAKDAFGNAGRGTTDSFTILTSVSDVPTSGGSLELAAPAPNPFNPSTRLRFNLPEDGLVGLSVFDLRGHRIRTLLNENRARGEFTVHWDGRDGLGRAQSGGVYFFVLDFRGSGQSGRITRRAVLVP